MGLGEIFMRGFRVIFRDQRTRLRIDWLTHTDEQILEWIDANGAHKPQDIAHAIGRSEEYVADRCRQLALRGLLEMDESRGPTHSRYEVAEIGDRYLRDAIDAEELEEIAGLQNES